MNHKIKSMNDLIQEINGIIRRKEFIYEEFYSLLNGTKGIPIHSYKILKGQTFYRSRINKESKYFYNLKDLSYPEKENIRKFGRTNRPGQNLLYLSDTLDTSFSELIQSNIEKDKVLELTKTEWSIENDLSVRIIPDFENDKMNELIKDISNSYIKNQLDFLKILNFFFRAVPENGGDNFAYEITSAFCNALLAESIRESTLNDGTLYTSAQLSKGFNLSLKTDVVKTGKVKIIDVKKHYLRNLGNNIVVETEKPKKVNYKTGDIEWK